MSSVTSTTTAPRTTAGFTRAVLPAAAVAAIVVAAAHLLLDAAGVDFRVTMQGTTTTVTALQAGLTTLVAGVAGGGVALLLARRTARPRRTFGLLVALGVVLMTPGPLLADAPTGTVVALELLHLLAAAAVLAVALPRLPRR